jgi:hypothetical protein
VNTEDIHRTDIKRELPCRLSPDEMLDIAVRKSKLEGELEELEEEFSEEKRSWNKRLEELEGRIGVMRSELRTGEQRRVVTCFERWRGQLIEIVRDDTGEVVDTRASTLRDTQQTIPGTGDAGDDEQQADAARTQRAAGVEEDEEGDVVPPESSGSGKRGKKKR